MNKEKTIKKDLETTGNSSKSIIIDEETSSQDNHNITQNEEICKYLENTKEEWLIDGKVDELAFAKLYLTKRPMMYYKQFYDVNEMVDEMLLKRELINILSKELMSSRLITSVNNIIEFIRNECYINEYKPKKNTIHTLNSKLVINDDLDVEMLPKEMTINRLNVNYIPTDDIPEKWLAFLNELLIPMDIEILQEFLGYCLIATTEKQKALLIIGKQGGEGKSTILNVLQYLFGKSSMAQKTIDKMFNDRFGFARVNNKLVIYDDDMKPLKNKMLEPLKKFISLEEIEYEAKYAMEESLNHYARFIGLGNNILDDIKTDDTAFNRRLIVLNVKPKDPNRQDNTKLLDELKVEIDAIFNWSLQGLKRLIKNDFEFSYSEDMKCRVADMLKNDTDYYMRDFLEDNIYLIKDSEAETLSAELYDTYIRRCYDKNIEAVSSATFYGDLSRLATTLFDLKYLNKVKGEERRGYKGIRVVPKHIPNAPIKQEDVPQKFSPKEVINYDEAPY